MDDKLLTEVQGPVAWKDLKPHLERDVLFQASDKHDLLKIADAMREDNVELMKSWLDEKSFYKPSLEQIESWDQEVNKDQFYFVIASPYVVFQVVTH